MKFITIIIIINILINIKLIGKKIESALNAGY